MAEAHQAIGVFEEHKRGVELLYSDEGIRISFTIPPPWELRQIAVRNFHHFKRAVVRRVYPAPPIAAVVVMVVVMLIVVTSPSDSWWRNSWLAWFVWRIGNAIIPFTNYLPHSLYIAYLAAWTAFFSLLLLMWGQRLILRLLLSYRRWLYLNPKETSHLVTLWGALLKILGGRNPLTYSFQDALPRLPVPTLKETIERYLKSVHPLLDEEKYVEVEKMAKQFMEKEGKKFQLYLTLKSWWASNYVTDWWEKYVYLKGRTSLMINSNYYALPANNFNLFPSKNPLAIAAVITRLLMIFKQELDREQLSPMLIRGIVPLCMSQYQRIFSTTRLPGREEDILKKYRHKSKHLAVFCNGRIFKLPLFEKDARGRLLSFFELQRQFEWIKSTSDQLGRPTEKAEGHLPALTADGRINWAENREKFFSEGINKRSLEIIESSVFVLILDDKKPTDWSFCGKDLIHGNGSDRWFDKSFQIIVYANGVAGFNAEHAWADAPVMAHVWEYVQTQLTILSLFDSKSGNVKCLNESEKTSFLPPCKLLQWKMSKELEKSIENAMVVAQKEIEHFDLKVIVHEDYGKGLIKKFQVSPDGFIQMALQLAYYRNTKGTFTQTYESSMTRLYRDGRTETVRPVTDESKAFVLGMMDPQKTQQEKLQLLQIACEIHQQSYRNAMNGKGIDRHLFTLYCVSIGLGIESPFLKNALGRPWQLSTSQQPQQQTNYWKQVEKALEGTKFNIEDAFSPGGGFGPVAEHGYGVSYMVAGENKIFFHISSKKNSPNTCSEKFAQDIFQAFADMKKLWTAA
jgi:carnitine O-palmitoyltransferase 1